MCVKFDKIEYQIKCILRGMHFTFGSPVQPSGQEHLAWWLCVLQKASIAQGSDAQGSLHWELKQAFQSGHSWSLLHPTAISGGPIGGTGARKINNAMQ